MTGVREAVPRAVGGPVRTTAQRTARGAAISEFDVYIGYAQVPTDEAWVRHLAGRLHAAGLNPFLDQWEILAGEVVVQKMEEGIAESAAAIMVFSPDWVTEPWAGAQYSALMTRAIKAGKPLIPVLYRSTTIPAFADSRRIVDFTGAGGTEGPEWERRFAELLGALRSERPPRPGRPVTAVAEPAAGQVRAEHPKRMLLRVTADQVLFGPDEPYAQPVAVHDHGGVGPGLADRLRWLDHARRRGPAVNGSITKTAPPQSAEPGLAEHLHAVGERLGETFLDGPAGRALAEALDEAVHQHAALRLGIEVDSADLADLADLPWEALILPGGLGGFGGPGASTQGEPLALHPNVDLFRRSPATTATTAVGIRAPLRILAVMAAPEGRGSGPLLDLEAELARILGQVQRARHHAGAQVRVLNEGTLSAIEEAFKAERFHVLHISCHAAPGMLLLEDETGAVDPVTAERLAAAVPTDRGVPLIVLSGCSTALSVRTGPARGGPGGTGGSAADGGAVASDGATAGAADPAEAPGGTEAAAATETALGGLAHELTAVGMPAVLAMTAPVTDLYATELAGRFYYELAVRDRPEPLAALSETRRDLEAERRSRPPGSVAAALVEWATPALFLRGPSLPLYDVRDGVDTDVKPPTTHRLAAGVIVREVGEFVGRRAELRVLSAALRGDRTGVLLHGIGGVGKSTLAAELAVRLGGSGFVLSVVGGTSPDGLLTGIADDLLAATAAVGSEAEPIRQLAVFIREPKVPWQVRLRALGEHLLDQLPVTLLLDNFEDNLDADTGEGTWKVRDEELAGFLAAWIAAPGHSKLVITSRQPFPLPDDAHLRLHTHHLGPLSPAEAVKLIWRLPALNALSSADQILALADVGGHPRTLEYLDALLRSGTTRFPDIAKRLERLLKDRGITDPDAWFRSAGAGLDRALAEAVTLAVDDVLLGELVGGLDGFARRVLVGVSVFRVPVEWAGVAWPVSRVVEREPDPAGQERLRRAGEALAEVRRSDPDADLGDAGWSAEEVAQVLADQRALLEPPLVVPEGLAGAVGVLGRSGLLTPVSNPGGGPDTDTGGGGFGGGRWVVHRWTAATLAGSGLTPAEEVTAAHEAAATYWRWRVKVWPQGPAEDVEDLLEARFHLHAAGRLDEALAVTDTVCRRLHTWGAWGREEQLHRETLAWLPDPAGRPAAACHHQLGMIAQERGDYEEASEHYQRSLTILQELGDRAGISASYHQLGRIAELRGNYEEASEHYQRSLSIFQALGDRAGISTSYHQLGIIAQERGDYGQAFEHYQRSLTIAQELDDLAGTANSYGQLGNLAQAHGDYGEASEHYQRSLSIFQALGDRAGISRSYHQLGTIAQQRGDHEQASEQYQRSLTIDQELGDRAGIASTTSQIGALYTQTERAAEAVALNLAALATRLQLGSPETWIDLHWLSRQRTELGDPEFTRILADHLDPESTTDLLRMLDDLGAGDISGPTDSG